MFNYLKLIKLLKINNKNNYCKYLKWGLGIGPNPQSPYLNP